MKRKTIKNLMKSNKVIYVKLSNERVAEVFFALAKYDGFTLSEDLKPKECFVRLNDDMTITYPQYHSWAGAMKFHSATVENGKKVVKIDFEKLL